MWVPSGLHVHFAFMGVYVLGRQYASVLAAHVELQSGVAERGVMCIRALGPRGGETLGRSGNRC